MYLLIIRHGESEADVLNVHEGRADFELTKRGHMQAVRMADYIKDHYKISKIYASTLKRAKQTAEHLSDAADSKIIFDDNLMEFNNGLLAGLPRDVAAQKYPPVTNLPVDQAVYGMESEMDFRKRAELALNRVLNECKDDECIAVVSHGGMINQLYRAMLKLPIDCNVFWGTGDTGIHVWKLEEGKFKVVQSNIIEHTQGI